MTRLALLLALACTSVGLLAPTAQAAVTTVGIADQQADTFSDPLFAPLGVKHARLNLAWDAMDYDWQLAGLDDWMSKANAAGVTPLVIFSQSRVQGRTRLLPTSAQFGKVVDALRARYPFVREFAAWNEANHAGQPSYSRPGAVAEYYRILRTKCPSCTVLPASLLDNPNLVPWTLKLRKAIIRSGQPEPRLWGLHNYSDVNRLKDTSTRRLLGAVKGKVWLTETGGVVEATSPTASKFPQGAAYAGRVAKYILGPLIAANPRVERAYFYNWKPGGTSFSWDSGLVGADGAPRAAYQVIKGAAKGGVVRVQGKVVQKKTLRKRKGAKRQQRADKRQQRAGKRR